MKPALIIAAVAVLAWLCLLAVIWWMGGAPELEDVGEGFPNTVHADAGGHVRVVDATENPVGIAAVGVNPLQVTFEQTEQGRPDGLWYAHLGPASYWEDLIKAYGVPPISVIEPEATS